MFKDPVMVSNKKTGKLFVTTTIALVFLAVASATDLQNIEIIEPVDSRQINVTGNLSMEGNILEGVADPDNGNDVMDRDYADSRYLNRAGDYMTGNLDLNGYNITNFFNSTCNSDQLVNQVYENGSYNCVDPSTISTTENLAQTLTEGNYGGGTAIYMNQSGIFEIGESINLTASGNIEVSGTTDGINLDNPGNAISLSSNQYLIDSNAIGNDEIRFDAVNNSQLAQGTCSNDQVLKWNGSEWECVNTDGFGTDNQSLTGYNNTDGVNDTIYIENGNNITIRDDVADADADPTNELQNLSEVLVQGNVANQSIRLDDPSDVNQQSATKFNSTFLLGQERNTQGGSFTLKGGYGSDEGGGAIGGSLFIEGGDADSSSFSETPGSVYIDGGVTQGGVLGNVYIGSDNTDSVGIGTSSPDSWVDIEGGNLTVSGNSINDIDTLTGDSGAISVRNNLDLSGQSLSNYFGSACSNGMVVEDINDDGSFTCVDPVEDQGVENLSQTLEAGNVANQSIDMGDSQVRSVSALDFTKGAAQNLAPADRFGFHVETASYTGKSFNTQIQSGVDGESGIEFSNDGRKMFVVNDLNDNVTEWELSTPFDISTVDASSTSFFNVSGQDTYLEDIAFSNDGRKMFVVGRENDNVYEYPLGSAFDVSTADGSSVSSFDVSGEDSYPKGLAFSNDGRKMFVLGQTNNKVFEYPLGSAFDVSTADGSSVSSFDITEDSNPEGLAFSNDGRKMFVLGSSDEDIYEYSLSQPFNVSTADGSNPSRLDISDVGTPNYLAFSNDGGKMFSKQGDNVREFSLGLGVDSGDVDLSGNVTVGGVGNVTLENADLDLGNNDLLNVGGTECGSSETLLGDGSCGSPGTDDQNLSEVLVNGNVANQSIDMDNNNINDVDKINNENSQTVSTGGSVEVGDGNVGAPDSTRMCIGDRCT